MAADAPARRAGAGAHLHALLADDCMVVSPWVPELERVFSVTRSKRVQVERVDRKTGRKSSRASWRAEKVELGVRMVRPGQSPQGDMVGPRGLFDHAVAKLRRMGFNVTEERRESTFAPPDWSLMPSDVELRLGQPEMLAVMSAWRDGIIKMPPGQGKSFALALYCLCNPDLRIAVVTTTGSVRTQLYNDIASRVGSDRVWKAPSSKPPTARQRIMVCTCQGMHLLPDDIDVLIYDEVHSSGAANTSSILMSRFRGARRYGLSATPSARFDDTKLLPVALFGPIRVDMSYAEALAAGTVSEVDVWMYDVPVPDRLQEIAERDGGKIPSGLAEKLGVVCNWRRNELAARIASRLVPEGEKVLVLVEKVEHVFRLKALLPPDFVPVYRTMSPEMRERLLKANLVSVDTPLKVDVEGVGEMFKDGRVMRVVSTMCWREGMNFPDLCWLIRADGSGSLSAPVQIGGRLSRRPDGKSLGVLVDFFDRALPERSARRVEQYRNEGWNIHHMAAEAAEEV